MQRLAHALCALALVLLGAGGVGAGGPAWGAPASATRALLNPALTRDQHGDAQNAAVDLARKAAALDALGAFGSPPFEPLRQALAGLGLTTGTGRSALARQLESANTTAASALRSLAADGRPLGREVSQALTALSRSQLRVAESGGAISTAPQIYLAALDELALHDGAPPAAGTPPDPPAVHDALASAIAGHGAGGNGAGGNGPAGAASPGRHGSTRLPLIIAIAAAAFLAGVVLMRRRPRRSPAPAAAALPSTLAGTPASMHNVLEASRRLTGSTAAGDIERAVVREMLGLVPGRAGALLVAGEAGLRIAHETQPGLLIPSGFTAGLVAQAMRTRAPVTEQVVADASFSRAGVQVAIAPLLSEHRVTALMVVVRDGEPFGAGERAMLTALAPVAAAAMQSAARTQAAVDASMRDPLTGVGNRRELDVRLPAILAASSGGTTAFVMVDLDHFKSVNDTHGHPAGDALLRGVCAVINGALRPTDAVYRYGGEEFCLLLPGTSRDEAQQIAERVRTSIASTPFDIGGGQQLNVTASLGVAATDGADAADLVTRADGALYEAKRSGRDRVCLG